jgi:hypothetical protein
MPSKFSKACLTVAAALSTVAVADSANATTYWAKFTGIVLSGVDRFEVFGGGNLAGHEFTATFTANFTPATIVTNTGNAIAIGGMPSSAPIATTLTIKGQTLSFVGGAFLGLFGLAYQDPLYGNGVSVQSVASPYNGLDLEVENFDPLRPLLNGNFVTPVIYHVDPSDTVYGFFSLNQQEFGYLAPATIEVREVPEPASWAMVIMGMGLAGTMLRRRHAAVSFGA